MDRKTLAAMIDHTLLRPDATDADVVAVCEEGARLGVASVCVSPSKVAVAVRALEGTGVPVAAVAGFPSGAHMAYIKADEAASAVGEGAAEIDVVADLGALAVGDWAGLAAELETVRQTVPGACLKVILETALLTPDKLVTACGVAEAAGVDFVKTSTGFHPAGGATVEAVALMAKTVGGRLGVKASGGIRDTATALAMISAGATRIGASATAALLEGLPA